MPSSPRVFAAPAARHALAAGAGVLAVALVAGSVRVLPVFFAGQVPLRLLPVLARGIAGVALETALFVAPPIGFALAAARVVDRGEARALFAIGVGPLRIVADAWPAAAGMAAAAALAAALWGTEAAAPGRAVRALVDEARVACASAAPPAVADVPLLVASWVCLEGEAPRIVGPLGEHGAFAAASLDVRDDLGGFDATGLTIVTQGASADLPSARIQAASATVRGIAPIGRASNLRPWARAVLLGLSATALAAVSGGLVLARAIRSRTTALAVGAAGPMGALLVFSALERAPSPPAAYALVPAAGLGALLLAAWAHALRARVGRAP